MRARPQAGAIGAQAVARADLEPLAKSGNARWMFGFQAALILATAGKLFGIVWPADTAMTTADRDELATKGDLYRALWIAIVASLGGLIAIAAALNLL